MKNTKVDRVILTKDRAKELEQYLYSLCLIKKNEIIVKGGITSFLGFIKAVNSEEMEVTRFNPLFSDERELIPIKDIISVKAYTGNLGLIIQVNDGEVDADPVQMYELQMIGDKT